LHEKKTRLKRLVTATANTAFWNVTAIWKLDEIPIKVPMDKSFKENKSVIFANETIQEK